MSSARVLILAGESAAWRIAGLRQLDRILLSLAEWSENRPVGKCVTVCVFWDPQTSSEHRWLPKHRKLEGINLTGDPADFLEHGKTADLVLSTRWFLYRKALDRLSLVSPGQGAALDWTALSRSCEQMFAQAFPANGNDGVAEYVSQPSDIPACERRFLRAGGKSQDGMVSRYLNRPISCAITRLLLRLPLTPSAWTLLITVFPIGGTLLLTQGTYAGFVLGTMLFQVYSILDGCDGEIARAKFLESERGRQLDNLCDLLGTLLLVLGLGMGLARQGFSPGWYVAESIAVVFLLSANELILARGNQHRGENTAPASLDGALYERHRRLIQSSGMLLLGECATWWLIQLTKRDVALLAFVLLALLGWPAWILHALGIVSAVSLILATNARLKRPNSDASPP